MTAVRLAAIDATGLSLDALVVGLTGGKRDAKIDIPASSGLAPPSVGEFWMRCAPSQ